MRYTFLRFPEGKGKAVTLSYDDGIIHDIRLSEIISRYGIKCTFNLNCEALGTEGKMTTDDVKKHILSKGHEIAVHGEFHKAEGSIRPIEGITDVLNCRLELEKKYDMIVQGMAYPDCGITRFSNGASYDKIKNYLEELDITYARTLGGDNNSFMLPQDWHAWMPTAHHQNPKLLDWIDEFINIDISNKVYCASRQPGLFYLWGHSYEFERNNNWDLLEKICEKFAKSKDIWFATNGEIYNYVKAYSSLVRSANGEIVYNPTLIDVWFNVDEKLYLIKSGETIRL